MAKLPDGLRPDLAAALAEQASIVGAKKSFPIASAALRGGEKVLAATKGDLHRVGARAMMGTALVVTDQRVLLAHGVGSTSTVEEMPYATITSVTAHRGLTTGQISLTAAGITVELRNAMKNRVQPVADAIRQQMQRATTHGPPPPGATQRLDISAEIMKLHGLMNSGALTEAEFALAKDRLIRGT